MPDWADILSRDGKAVWRTAYRLLGSHADADECFQEAFLAALEFSRREPVRDWRALLQRLATARAIDRLRSKRRQVKFQYVADWDAIRGPASAPSRIAEDAELAEGLRSLLVQLPARQAEVFCLHCLEEWSYQEVAEHMAISVDSVGVLLHRARARLRQLVSDTRMGLSGSSQAQAKTREEPL